MEGVLSPVLELRVPCLAEYVSLVRLAVLGLCGRVPLSYDDVEDLRLAVGEACASSVFRCSQAQADNCHIKLTGAIEDSLLMLEIEDDVPMPPQQQPEDDPNPEIEFDDQHFRVSLMQLLVDSVEIDEVQSGGQVVRLVKKCEPPSEPEG